MNSFLEIFDYELCISYDGKWFVYCEGENDNKHITPGGLGTLADALIFVGEHMKATGRENMRRREQAKA